MKNLGGSPRAGANGYRRARARARERFSFAAGSCGVILAASAGCADPPRAVPNAAAGQSGGLGASAGNAAVGGSTSGTSGSSGTGGHKAPNAKGGTGNHPNPSSSGVGGTGVDEIGGESGSGADAGGGAGGETAAAGGRGGTAQVNDAGGAAGDASGAPGTAPDTGGSGGLTSTGGFAGTSAGGTGGYVDVEEPFDGPCPGSVMNGWATVAGLDFDPAASTTAATEVVVTDAAALQTYAASTEPYVIRISGTIATPVVDVTSNKTIMGDDSLATLQGGIRLLGTATDPTGMISNVVIKNLHIDATNADTSTLPDEDDGISIAYAHHVWIDHVDVWDAPGDGVSISNGSDYITVSWSKFRFVSGVRRTATRIGHSDANAAEDTDRLKVTLHHNWWTDSVDQRMPRVRFGQVHLFDNYYSNRNTDYPDNTYCIAAGYESELLVENNFFDEAYNPHVFFSFTNNVTSYSEPTAQMVATGNTYVGVSDLDGGKQSGQGSAFDPPYDVTLEPADDVLRNTIRHCAGDP